jgi:hypothetical protein
MKYYFFMLVANTQRNLEGEMEAADWLTMKIVKKYYNWWWKFWL